MIITSVTTPRVPSDPTYKCVRSYPADDFLARDLVLTISPLGSTTVMAKINLMMSNPKNKLVVWVGLGVDILMRYLFSWILFHGPISNSIGAGARSAHHATNRSTRARIQWEKQPYSSIITINLFFPALFKLIKYHGASAAHSRSREPCLAVLLHPYFNMVKALTKESKIDIRGKISSLCKRTNLFIFEKSMVMPPTGAIVCPSSDVPAPYGIMGTLCWAHSCIQIN